MASGKAVIGKGHVHAQIAFGQRAGNREGKRLKVGKAIGLTANGQRWKIGGHSGLRSGQNASLLDLGEGIGRGTRLKDSLAPIHVESAK